MFISMVLNYIKDATMNMSRSFERIGAQSVALFVLLSVFVGCTSASKDEVSIFSEELYTPKFASGFEIVKAEEGESSLLRITKPWQGATDKDQEELLILRGGEQKPAGYKGNVLNEKAERIVALSSTFVAMFDRVEATNLVVGVSGIDYISNPIIGERARTGLVKDVGYDSNLNFELLTTLRPDIVLLYSSSGANSSVVSKLTELNIPYLYIGDYAEESPLGKAEWMVAMAEICGRREQGIKHFEQSAAEYNRLKDMVQSVENRPKVMFNTPYRDVWFMPTANNYMVQLIEDAGAEYIYKGNSTKETKPISVEEAYKLVLDTDFWLNTGAMINSIGELRNQIPKFGDMPVVKRGNVYNNTARRTPMGGSDFWESGVVFPEIVLRDMIAIFHPEIVNDPLYFYMKLE